MSYDVDMVIRQDEMQATVCECGNYTYNVRPMYSLAGIDGLYSLCGMRGHEAAPILDKAIAHMEANRAAHEKLNPSNGWGDYTGALNFLRKIRTGCGDYPNAYLSVS